MWNWSKLLIKAIDQTNFLEALIENINNIESINYGIYIFGDIFEIKLAPLSTPKWAIQLSIFFFQKSFHCFLPVLFKWQNHSNCHEFDLFTKFFDTINHDILLQKFHAIGYYYSKVKLYTFSIFYVFKNDVIIDKKIMTSSLKKK